MSEPAKEAALAPLPDALARAAGSARGAARPLLPSALASFLRHGSVTLDGVAPGTPTLLLSSESSRCAGGAPDGGGILLALACADGGDAFAEGGSWTRWAADSAPQGLRAALAALGPPCGSGDGAAAVALPLAASALAAPLRDATSLALDIPAFAHLPRTARAAGTGALAGVLDGALVAPGGELIFP
jgi:hypothetical protein